MFDSEGHPLAADFALTSAEKCWLYASLSCAVLTCLSCDFDIPCIRLFVLTLISPVAKRVRSYEKLETNLSIWLKLPDSTEDLVACLCGLK